jgi:hypothetical protein
VTEHNGRVTSATWSVASAQLLAGVIMEN